jgi:hypothetical protein
MSALVLIMVANGYMNMCIEFMLISRHPTKGRYLDKPTAIMETTHCPADTAVGHGKRTHNNP